MNSQVKEHSGHTNRIFTNHPVGKAQPDPSWQRVREQFLAAIEADQRAQVAMMLQHPSRGGHGLRCWLRNLVWSNSRLPSSFPRDLICVYLTDQEALPLHDCSGCGLLVPVRPAPYADYESEPAWEYFPLCPFCGSSTGLFAYAGRNGAGNGVTSN